MSDDDLIRRGDALAKIHWLSDADWTVSERRAAGEISESIAALPAVNIRPDYMAMMDDEPAAAPVGVAEALAVVKAWAMREIVVDTCIPKENREPGCLSCDTLAFLEAAENEIAAIALAQPAPMTDEQQRRFVAEAPQRRAERIERWSNDEQIKSILREPAQPAPDALDADAVAALVDAATEICDTDAIGHAINDGQFYMLRNALARFKGDA